MGKPKAPAPPDPKETAAAQTGTNVTTATANSLLNNFNQVTPDGTLTYSTEGYETLTDPASGQSYQVPIRTATTELSPEQQAIADQNNATQFNLAEIGNNQSGFLKDYLSEPVSLGNEEVESRLFDLGSKRLDPRFDEAREGLETRLANQGIRLGTEAYDRAMGNFAEQENDAYNQLLLGGRAQAVQEQLSQRNQPINEITALLSGSQVSQPNFVGTNSAQIPTTDYAGLVNQNYQNQLSAYNQKMAGNGSMWGTIGSLAGKAIAGGSFPVAAPIALSDERAKKDKKKVGKVNGMGLYEFRYKGQPKRSRKQVGLMAQEVKKTRPDAVSKRPDGLYQVDYRRALA